MSWCGKKVLAVVPARGGSKTIPRKNLAKLGGKTLVAIAADMALSLPWVDRAILSTDDGEIAEEGRFSGLEVPFSRPFELADDKSNSIDAWRHAWLMAELHYGVCFDYSILLEPTSPMRTSGDIERCMELVGSDQFDSAVTVSRTPAHYTPHKTLTISDEGVVGFYLKNGNEYSLRQSIPPYFHRNGLCYATSRDCLINKGVLLGGNCSAVIVERPVVNIDELIDLSFAEFLMRDDWRSNS